ncbi:hypothetical protein AURDEDRAFT_167854 [Auricularia subglabra TFB-10046 SS5]|nr:hypothetical protein AURDEDRAFT_167854 [Auricularia subglabra TFB-10046 SS5]
MSFGGGKHGRSAEILLRTPQLRAAGGGKRPNKFPDAATSLLPPGTRALQLHFAHVLDGPTGPVFAIAVLGHE